MNIAQSLCLLHCTKVHLMQKVCKCIQNDHFSPYEDNESITAIDLNRRTSIAEQRKSRCCLTGKSNLYGMVLNSLAGAMAKKNSLVSTQPGSVLPLAEASGLPFFDILLTLQGIFCYYLHKVLKRPTQAEYITLVSSGFFTSIDYLWPSVGLIKDLPWQGIRQPSTCGFEPSAAHSKGAISN